MRFAQSFAGLLASVSFVAGAGVRGEDRRIPPPPALLEPLRQATPLTTPPILPSLPDRNTDPHEDLKIPTVQNTQPMGGGGADAPVPVDTINVGINQRFFIRPSGLKDEATLSKKDLSFDRPDILGLEDLGEKQRQVFFNVLDKEAIFSARKLGTVRITYHPREGPPQVFTINVRPDLTYLNKLLETRFPTAKLNVVATGDSTVLLDGFVDSPGDSFAAETLLRQFKLGVINNTRVGGVMQVQLDVVIVRVDRQELRRLGFNTLLADTRVGGGSTIGNVANTPAFSLPSAASAASGASAFNPIGTGVAPLNAAANLFFGVTDSSKGWFAFIEALRQNNAATILANPVLVTYNGRTADFLVGGRQPVPRAGTLGVPSVEFETFGTRLTFLPTILGEGKIRLEIVPEVSSVDTTNTVTTGGIQVPSFIVQRLHATVELQSSQTLCLGGLLQTQIEAQSEKVPLLGDLPGVGGLFRRVRHRTRETELLVLVTPRLVDPLQRTQAPRTLPGQEFGTPTDSQLFLNGQLETRKDECEPSPPVVGDGMSASVAPGNRSNGFAADRRIPGPAAYVLPSPAQTLPAPTPISRRLESHERYLARGAAPEEAPEKEPAFVELLRNFSPEGSRWR